MSDDWATRGGVARGAGELPTGGCVPQLGPQTLTWGGDGLRTGKPQSAVRCLVPRGCRLDCAATAPGSAPQPQHTASQPPMTEPMWRVVNTLTGGAPHPTALAVLPK